MEAAMIDLSSSSKTFSKEDMDRDSEAEEIHVPRKRKRFCTGFWDLMTRFKRVVENRVNLYFGNDEVERTRVYHVWPGNNVFFFKGRLICGSDPRGLLLTIFSISLSSWTFVVHVASDDQWNLSTIIISLILTVIVLVNLGIVSATDPGIVPRNDNSSPEIGSICGTESENSRRRKVININGTEVKLKYCRICNIYRPPRSCHCAICNNCVEKFDHHCPLIGQCIGLRNYRSYMIFLFTGFIYFSFMFIFSYKRIHQKLYGDGFSVIGLLRNCPEAVALAIFSFAALCFLAGLSCFNVFLVMINQTAYENFHQKYGIGSGTRNPYNQGMLNNLRQVLLSSPPPPRVNFLAEVDPGLVGEMEP